MGLGLRLGAQSPKSGCREFRNTFCFLNLEALTLCNIIPDRAPSGKGWDPSNGVGSAAKRATL